MTKTPAAVEPSKIKLNAMRFGLADGKRNTWHAVVPAGVPYSSVFDPIFWSHCASRGPMQPGDWVEVRDDENTYVSLLVVRDVGPAWAKVIQFGEVCSLDAGDEKLPESAEYDVRFKGPHLKWCVIRLKDNVTMTEGIKLKVDAQRWLVDNMRSIAA